jgi:outer membrane protein assembly factor BamD (BamD/ComL family)
VTRLMMVLLLSSIFLSGCARIIGGQDTEMYRAESLLRERDYSEAIDAYRQIAKETDDPERAAHAQFALASALAYYDNSLKDYAAAFQEFDQFLKMYPDDEKANEARQWRSLLRMIVELEKVNENLNKNIEQYKQNIEHLNKSIEQLKQLDIRHEERRRK